MSEIEMKAGLRRCLQEAREALLWKLEGLGDGDLRRPLTPTGTNLLGLVKHLATVEMMYLGYVFGRPFPEPVRWSGPGSEPGSDMWAEAGESRPYLIDLYRRVWVHSDAVLGELLLDAAGTVPWWPEEARRTTLHRVLLVVIGESHRHAGHADIVRELIDGEVGRLPGEPPRSSRLGRESHLRRLELIAREAADPD